MFKKSSFIFISVISLFISAISAYAQENDSYTIVTYYPSPYGVYNELRLYPHYPSPTCDSTQEGNMYYDNDPDQPSHALKVCMYTGAIYEWVNLGGAGGGGGWTDDGAVVRLTDIGDNVGIGTTAPGYKLHLAADGAAYLALDRASADTSGNHIYGLKSRGTQAASTIVTSGDDLLLLRAYGYDGASNLEAARITMDTEGTVASTRMPGNIRFYTATNAAPSVLTEWMRINSAGNVGIGTTSPTQRLDVNGKVRVNDSVIYNPRAGSGSTWPAGLEGELAYSNTDDEFYYYDGLNWVAQAAGGGSYTRKCGWGVPAIVTASWLSSFMGSCTPPACASGYTSIGVDCYPTAIGFSSSWYSAGTCERACVR